MPKVRERAGGSAGDKTLGPELADCWLVPCLVLRTRSKTLAGLCGLRIVRATGGRALHPSSFAPPRKAVHELHISSLVILSRHPSAAPKR